MQQIFGILFDKDGTLFDFNATWAVWAGDLLHDLAASRHASVQVLGAAIGFDVAAARFDSASPVIAGTPDEIAALLLPHLNGLSFQALVRQMNAAAAQAPMQPAVPLAPLLAQLADRNLRLGVATNDAEAPARAHLEAAGVAARFEFIAGCDSGFGAKPAPGQMRAFAEAVNLAPEAVLMVGDSRHDLLAGRAAGMGTIAVLTGLATADDLADLADAVLPDIGHLPAYLDNRAR